MDTHEQLLHRAADGEILTSPEWHLLRPFILTRLDQIVSDFPPPPPQSNSAQHTLSSLSTQSSSSTDKENAPPSSRTLFSSMRPPPPPTPVQLATRLQAEIRDKLATSFPNHPPHTIQRLAELLLFPKRNYRFLPAYLQALNRVVHVTSDTSRFPLTPASVPTAPIGFGLAVNGHSASSFASPTDDALGGAALTPIPWLVNPSPHSDDFDPDHDTTMADPMDLADTSAGAELSPDDSTTINGNSPEQVPAASEAQAESAPLAPTEPMQDATPTSGNDCVMQDATSASDVTPVPENVAPEPEVEPPHARGPDQIDAVDTGPPVPSGTGGVAGLLKTPTTDSEATGAGAQGEQDKGDKDSETEIKPEDKQGASQVEEKKHEATSDDEKQDSPKGEHEADGPKTAES